MSFCGKVHDYLDQRLSQDDDTFFEAHLMVCNQCRQTVERWQRTAVALKDDDKMIAEQEPTRADIERFMARAEERHVRRISRRPLQPAKRRALAGGLATATAAGVIACVFLMKSETVPATTDLSVGGASGGSEAMAAPRITLEVVYSDGRIERSHEPLSKGVIAAPIDGRLWAKIGENRIGLSPSGRLSIVRAQSDDMVLKLLQGTVACEVSPKAAGRAFVVEAGPYRVRVVGTRFAVTRQGDQGLEVIVEQGIVDVHYGKEKVAVSAGEQLTMTHGVPSKTEPIDKAALAGLTALLREEDPEPPSDSTGRLGLSPDTEDHGPNASTDHPTRKRFASGSAQEARDKALKRWQQAIISGHLAKTETEIGNYLKENTDDLDARELMADCQRKAGRWRAAVASYTAISSSPSGLRSARARFIAATVLQDNLFDCEQAREQYVEYLKLPPEHVLLRDTAELRLVQCLLTLNREAEARRLLLKILKDCEGRLSTAEPATRSGQCAVTAAKARQLLEQITPKENARQVKR